MDKFFYFSIADRFRTEYKIPEDRFNLPKRYGNSLLGWLGTDKSFVTEEMFDAINELLEENDLKPLDPSHMGTGTPAAPVKLSKTQIPSYDMTPLKLILWEHGYTVTQVARILGMSISYVSTYMLSSSAKLRHGHLDRLKLAIEVLPGIDGSPALPRSRRFFAKLKPLSPGRVAPKSRSGHELRKAFGHRMDIAPAARFVKDHGIGYRDIAELTGDRVPAMGKLMRGDSVLTPEKAESLFSALEELVGKNRSLLRELRKVEKQCEAD